MRPGCQPPFREVKRRREIASFPSRRRSSRTRGLPVERRGPRRRAAARLRTPGQVRSPARQRAGRNLRAITPGWGIWMSVEGQGGWTWMGVPTARSLQASGSAQSMPDSRRFPHPLPPLDRSEGVIGPTSRNSARLLSGRRSSLVACLRDRPGEGLERVRGRLSGKGDRPALEAIGQEAGRRRARRWHPMWGRAEDGACSSTGPGLATCHAANLRPPGFAERSRTRLPRGETRPDPPLSRTPAAERVGRGSRARSLQPPSSRLPGPGRGWRVVHVGGAASSRCPSGASPCRAFLRADSGIMPEVREDHAIHLAGGPKVPEEDERAILRTGAYAQKMAV